MINDYVPQNILLEGRYSYEFHTATRESVTKFIVYGNDGNYYLLERKLDKKYNLRIEQITLEKARDMEHSDKEYWVDMSVNRGGSYTDDEAYKKMGGYKHIVYEGGEYWILEKYDVDQLLPQDVTISIK